MTYAGVSSGRRRFLTGATAVVGAVGTAFTAVPFVTYWLPSEKAKAVGAPVEVDISRLEPAQRITVMWRGKPVWVVRRTAEMLAELERLGPRLRDPDSEVTTQQPPYCRNPWRSIRKEYLVVIGICTHLGCVPAYVPREDAGRFNLLDWPGGFFCPCHGSRFDLAGRVFKGVPAPANLVVPPHRYLTEVRVEVGVDQGTSGEGTA